jgi:Tol biopolymer transport system component
MQEDAMHSLPPAVRARTSVRLALALFSVACSTPERSAAPPLQPRDADAALTDFAVVPTLAFASNRHDPSAPDPWPAAEIYLMNENETDVRRITTNGHYDAFASISPDQKKIAYDSDSSLVGQPSATYVNPNLWVMDADGGEQSFLDHGASSTWSSDGKRVAYHASASGTGAAIRADPSSATIDSDIFTIVVDDALAGIESRVNLTNSPEAVDDDPDWSPTADVIAYTSHASINGNHANPLDAEIYVRNADGSGEPTQLTFNNQEERAPAWSPDGTKILYMCRVVFDEATQAPISYGPDFEVCLMNADGTQQRALTNNPVADLTPNWSSDGTRIFFHRPVVVLGVVTYQLFVMNADGTQIRRITSPPGSSAFANAGYLRVHVKQ